MKIKEILNLIKGELLEGDYEGEINAIEQDTRLIQNGDTFIAFKGKIDGNDFVNVAIEKGASTVIVNIQNIDTKGKKCNVIYVEDSLYALQEIIRYKMNNINTKVIGITGSVGKTSTREIVTEVLSTKYSVFKNEKNFNGLRGLPLTCSKIDNEDISVIEMGMDGLGQIDLLSNIVKPKIGVITNIGSSHIGILGSKENILKAKTEILNGIRNNGFLILNIDDEYLNNYSLSYKKDERNISLITFGINNENAMFNATNIKEKAGKTYFNVNITPEINLTFEINSLGTHNIYNSLTSIIIGKIFDLTHEEIQKGLLNLKSTERRLQKIELNNFILYDDSYNASYESVKAAIDFLSKEKSKGRYIYILGDVLELGDFAEEYHRKIGDALTKNKIDVLITAGENSIFINEQLNENGIKIEQYHFNNVDDLIENLIQFKENDTVLVKASNGMKFNKLVSYLKENFSNFETIN